MKIERKRMMNREEVIKILKEHQAEIRGLGARRLGIFGSVARNEGRAQSDLDFLVDLEYKTFDAYMDLKFFLEDIFQCRVDLVLIDSIKPGLRENILKETVYV